ncbi:hypothetical protein ACER0C_015103 [Sarotherodon galilaeus]
MRANQRTAAGHQSEYIRTAGPAACSLPRVVFRASGSPQERSMGLFEMAVQPCFPPCRMQVLGDTKGARPKPSNENTTCR